MKLVKNKLKCWKYVCVNVKTYCYLAVGVGNGGGEFKVVKTPGSPGVGDLQF